MAYTQWAAGMRITAARLAAMTPKFGDWVPTWTTSTGLNTPSYGNATIECRYAQTGDLVVAEFRMTFGSTTNFGGGGTGDNWRWTLPVTAASVQNAIGFAELNQSANQAWVGKITMASTTTFGINQTSGSPDGAASAGTGSIDAVSPGTWANGDTIAGIMLYEAA